MAQTPEFELWLEFEHWTSAPHDHPADDFFNMQVRLRDRRIYAVNVWTFGFLDRQKKENGLVEYLLAPDLFVERLDRKLMERVVAQLLARDEMKKEWLCPPGSP